MCILLQQMELVLNGVDTNRPRDADVALSIIAMIIQQGCDEFRTVCATHCPTTEPARAATACAESGPSL